MQIILRIRGIGIFSVFSACGFLFTWIIKLKRKVTMNTYHILPLTNIKVLHFSRIKKNLLMLKLYFLTSLQTNAKCYGNYTVPYSSLRQSSSSNFDTVYLKLSRSIPLPTTNIHLFIQKAHNLWGIIWTKTILVSRVYYTSLASFVQYFLPIQKYIYLFLMMVALCDLN